MRQEKNEDFLLKGLIRKTYGDNIILNRISRIHFLSNVKKKSVNI